MFTYSSHVKTRAPDEYMQYRSIFPFQLITVITSNVDVPVRIFRSICKE